MPIYHQKNIAVRLHSLAWRVKVMWLFINVPQRKYNQWGTRQASLLFQFICTHEPQQMANIMTFKLG
jgi:hypothetical protein